jgi:Zn-dependent protease
VRHTGDVHEREQFGGYAPPTAVVEPTLAPPVGLPPQPEPEPERPAWRRYLGPVAFGLFAIFKWGKALLLLLPKAKFFTTSATMLVSVAAYSLIWGWKFAAGIVVLLLVHEMGHVIQLRREGIEASAPVFIPFLGAAVAAKSLGGNALAEARVGLAGPVLGTLGTAVLVVPAVLTGDDFWKALMFTGFFLNLFNLLPVVPLDGGRAFAALSPWMWFAGLFAIGVMVFVIPNPILVLIALFAVMETWRRWKTRHDDPAYYKVRPAHRLAVAGVYVGLLVVLAVGMDLTFVERSLEDARG